ncbi:MAG: rubrerythrin family protein [Ignavibacteria bacterium GWA2_55_11]|nr:MAG: rubrerythrin family protein [Ignavibacteria bacterium GWA2_55_11]OGU43639.1 MAG: rubrerythrin family protein [Ignavibacteria bacterium GWC2_56_12]OGU63851.1 MAG: rubrerythrin family protein [Ignavibacteria bacterium RIFCSPHIGHO2_02_FULL_56_12]OGU69918.1 MAG: rubrerythrin family protein [Ignavibacteria bacterium RIFCSPLOWO2_02_FULL_55_14]OGU76407.1 MAG: rubrerythrin family protein [Ignavibacteria bacterium RIFCSPLOWO2_12_FULL_56_21]HAV22784.1 rubrerythrin family protein [Bacteroidota ba
MAGTLSPSLTEQAGRFMDDEHFDHLVYRRMADVEHDPRRKELLLQLSAAEERHAVFWRDIAGREPKPVSAFRIRSLITLRRLAGLMFTLKFLERHEHDVVEEYRLWLPALGEQRRAKLQEILKDEEEHEHAFMVQVDEAIVRYIGFVALGLSDAIIEISGVHAGFLGVMGSTVVAGVAGLVVGFAACISMGVAAYMKAKSETRQAPLTSAFITSGAYLLAVVLLAAPYFVTHSMLLAFSVSVFFAIVLSVMFTFYVAIVNDTNFHREVVENTLLLLGTAAATYFFGEALGSIFGLQSPMAM